MRAVRLSAVIIVVLAAASASAQTLAPVESSREVPTGSRVKLDAGVVGRSRYAPIGLSLHGPFERGKIPVIFIHGLWALPRSWARMIESLEADLALGSRCQFWTFGYSTGDPIPYSAALLRRDLDEVRRKLNPDDSDEAFDRMVLVGHSMGGLLTNIADRRDPPRPGGSDGLVPYESAHLDGTASEFLVSSGHLCQENPAVIREIRRILLEHSGR